MKVVSKVSVGTAELDCAFWDFIYFMDFPLLAYLSIKSSSSWIGRPFKFRSSVALSLHSQPCSFQLTFSWLKLSVPISCHEGFSNYYIVRALSLPAFLGYSANQSYSANKERAKASETDLQPITDYIQEHSAKPNPDYFGFGQRKKCDLSPLGELPAISS